VRRTTDRTTRDAARTGRFSTRFLNRDQFRVRDAGWSSRLAWRRGLFAAFVPWVGGVFWPNAYVDLFDYTFWPSGYYDGYWAYAYDDFFDGIWWERTPSYVVEEVYQRPVATAPAPSGAGTTAVAPPPSRRTAATTGEAACGETGRGLTAWPFDRIQSAINPTEKQQNLLEVLRDAAVEAADILRDSCPKGLARTPVERLRAMADRLEATLEAVKIVRPALERFYDSLDDGQRARFEALGPKLGGEGAPVRAGRGSAACGEDKPGLANFPIEKIQEVVNPTEDQLDLLDQLEDATMKALDALKNACPDTTPETPGERLAATQSRLEAMVEAAKIIEPALEDFYSALNAEQKVRFDKLSS
jgi:hypothetical protein